MKKLLLIHPVPKEMTQGYGDTEAWGMPPLALGYIAALTPSDWHIKIVDEYVEKLDINEKPDLVGITSYSVNATRAYKLASEFKQKGIPTVIGGIHVSMMPEEAAKYVNTVVVGEAESIWMKVISDFENGQLKEKYVGDKPSLVNLPIPKRDLFSEKYKMDVIQTSRGCPFNCEFCSVTAFNGAEYRQRPVEEVLDELQTIMKKVVYFVDDNILGVGKKAEERAIDLFKGMMDRKIRKIWGTQTSINIIENEDVLKYAYKSGCRALYIGIESIKDVTLKEMRKGVNLKLGTDRFKHAISIIHKHGIGVIGSFIVGNDNEDITIFDELVRFIQDTKIDVLQLAFLTPFPGTKLFERLKMEDRIIYSNFPSDWDRCDMDQLMIIPKLMTVDQLVRGYDYVIHNTLSSYNILKQFLKTLIVTKSVTSSIFTYSLNKDYLRYILPERKF
ncbi:MAG: radical SAM protein [Spirochaetota bacterium]|nr:radical SAM protein [Spirochaetota bacterium]